MMTFRKIRSFHILSLLSGWGILTIAMTLLFYCGYWGEASFILLLWIYLLFLLYKSYRKNVDKVTFMFDAIDNADYAFKYATENCSTDDRLVNESLNRITQILFRAREEAQQREKYYELILNSVTTGIVVIDEKGNIYQTNREALRLLGLETFTHISQLTKVSESVQQLFLTIPPRGKHQTSFQNERGTVNLSVRASGVKLKGKVLRILALNDINNEMDEKELDSWIRLTRVLTHEIMNSVTPITSLSDTLLSKEENTDPEIRRGLEVIRTTGKGLIDFVENYRKFTHIPSPQPELFYVKDFVEKMRQLAMHQFETSAIQVEIDVQPADLIVYADENLITHVVLNLLKNAMQAIESERKGGRVLIKAFCNEEEAVLIEISNNGPMIPPEEAEHIFVPFFTTKENGSGIGLSISRQIMRLSGGTLTLRSDSAHHLTIFTLMFP